MPPAARHRAPSPALDHRYCSDRSLQPSRAPHYKDGMSKPAPPIEPDATPLERQLEATIEGEVRFDRITRALYATDASVFQILPLGVVLPRSVQDVVGTVHLCRDHGVSITARGGGTSQAGQAIGPGVQLDFSKYMNRALVLHPEQRWVRVEPGIVLDELNALLKPYGLHLPVDISTSDRATIGGMIANNSAGTRSVVYGKMIDYVLELTVVLSDGSVVELRPVDAVALAAKCGQPDLEGACYRVVRRLAAAHAVEIDRRFPKILRRVGGYNLDEFVPGSGHARRTRVDAASDPAVAPDDFQLAKLIVGSEGTLALVVAAKLRLVPLPPARAVAVVHFHDLLGALAATPAVLEHRPSAVELLDRFILNTTRHRTEFEPLRGFLTGDPAAVLIVELTEQSAGDLPERLDRLEADLHVRRLGYHVHRAPDAAAQGRIWKLRRAALGLSMSQRGDAKASSFVEDTAVAPERLRDYIERFLRVLDAHGTTAGFYAHASVGLLHVRPVVNLKSDAGVEQFQQIARAIADLVLEFGGALSGEHGDGLVRSPFQEKMYGPVLYEAFCEVKRTFDPAAMLNPGKIVHAPPLAANLRYGPGYRTPELPGAFDFSDFGGVARAAEQCAGVGECRKRLAGTMCPSYVATRDEVDCTRGRANALRLASTGQFGLGGLSEPLLYRVLEMCLECKACQRECPTGVDMARLKAEFLYQFQRRYGSSSRSRLLSRPDAVGRWGSRLWPFSNWLIRSAPARWLAEWCLGLDRRRKPPRFARRSFVRWFHARQPPRGATGPNVALFPDTFSNFYEPEIAQAAVECMESAGHRVVVPAVACCGRPLISKGFLDAARARAESVVHALLPIADAGTPLVFCEPSCYSAIRDDYPHLVAAELRGAARRVADHCLTFDQWAEQALASRMADGADIVTASRGAASGSVATGEVLLHTHCHQRALVGTTPGVRLLAAWRGGRVTDLDAGCCGMAGAFGYEHEHYEISRRIGEHRLFPALRSAGAASIVVAAGFSCRHQIEHFTGLRAIHPAVLWKRPRT
jgi:FAD/FMN-containing dehydrogenase/Fe-S oxidoreductase